MNKQEFIKEIEEEFGTVAKFFKHFKFTLHNQKANNLKRAKSVSVLLVAFWKLYKENKVLKEKLK